MGGGAGEILGLMIKLVLLALAGGRKAKVYTKLSEFWIKFLNMSNFQLNELHVSRTSYI